MIPLSLAVSMLSACGTGEGIGSLKPQVYYVDSGSGKDDNAGTSADSPWSSLEKVSETRLYPGDSIRFKRGSAYEGNLQVRDSGSPDHFITLCAYGDTSLPAPSFTNPLYDPGSGNFGNCIRIRGQYIIVENLFFHHTVAELPSTTGGFTSMWQLGAVHVDSSSGHCILRGNEFLDCGAGIRTNAPYVLIEQNYIHDCNRVLKEWNWGPIGIWLGADHQEVSGNRVFNYSAVDRRIHWGPDSYGGGADGGAIEIDDARRDKSDISIHHNYTRDCQGFLEVTWTDVQKRPGYSGFRIHHNISDDYQQFIAMWRGSGCRIENNTIIRRNKNANDWGVFNITQDSSYNFIRNNIVVVENGIVVFNTGRRSRAIPCSIIENNLYYAHSGALNMGLEGPGERSITGNPLFLNYTPSADPGSLRLSNGSNPVSMKYANGGKASDFSIIAGSPAINTGMDLGYTSDFTGMPIPQEGRPDIGAFEYSKHSVNYK